MSFEAARQRHSSVDLCLDVVACDAGIGGGVLGGALAFRLFEYIVPLALVLVAGLGLYAGASDQAPQDVVGDSGLTGLIAREVAASASTPSRLLIIALTLPWLAYFVVSLYRTIAIVHAIAWRGYGGKVKIRPRGLLVFVLVLAAQLIALRLTGIARDRSDVAGAAALALYVAAIAAGWLLLSVTLPHDAGGWRALVPGAVLFGIGMLVLHAVNAHVVTWLVESRSETYGALGVATAFLFSLYLTGRLIVAAPVLNATLVRRRLGSPA